MKRVGVVEPLVVQAAVGPTVAGGDGGVGVGGVLPRGLVHTVEQALAQYGRQVGFPCWCHWMNHPAQLGVDPVQHGG